MQKNIITSFSGPKIYSEFRKVALLNNKNITLLGIKDITSSYLHVIESKNKLSSKDEAVIKQILTYGENTKEIMPLENIIFISPRIGTISPWSSRATDIIQHCGVDIVRIERVKAISFRTKTDIPLTEDEKVALAVINKEGDALRNSLNVQATDDSLVRIDETGGLGPAVKATEETAERTEVETGLIAGDAAEQDATNKALRIAQGEEDHDARIKQMLKDTDSYNEDGTLITEEQVKAKQAAEDKVNQDKLNAANAEKREGQMRKAEMALTGLKAAAGILSLSQALRAPDVETPELDPLIYEALSKQKALSESGLTAKEKGAAMQNMGDAYAGAMKNVLRASGGQRGMYLANQGTVDAQRIQGLNQLAAQDAAVHRENIKEYNSLATSVGSMKLNRDMNVEQMRQATLSNNRQILSGVGSNLLSDAISDVSYYMNPNRKATEDLIKNLSGKKGKDDGYDTSLLNQKITTANITPEQQAAIDKEAAANAKNTTN